MLQRQSDALQAQQSILSAGDSLSSADRVVVLELRVVNPRRVVVVVEIELSLVKLVLGPGRRTGMVATQHKALDAVKAALIKTPDDAKLTRSLRALEQSRAVIDEGLDKITVESAPDEGTRVTVRLPLRRPG